jgi:glycosyltransferase involved in cell wall biosynthesis
MSGSLTRPRVFIVGPVSPYRGGIAQYTESLAARMSEIADVQIVSFRKQYPKSLYPGESDVDRTKEFIDGVWYDLDATGPLTWRRTVDRIVAAAPDLVLFNWWTLYWQPWTAYMARRLRRRGVRVVFICHNIGDHGSGAIRQRIGSVLLSSADGFIVHSEETELQIADRIPGRQVLRRPIPGFDSLPPARGELPARGRLDLLFFGFIRPYKGLDVLLDAMEILDDPDVSLTIVGEAWEDGDAIRTRAVAVGAEVVMRYVGDAEAAEFFDRADAVVLPYTSAAGSGVVAAAFHYGKPVIASRVGGLIDVVDESTGVLVEPGDAQSLAQAIGALTRGRAAALSDGARTFARNNTWDRMATAIVDEFTSSTA